MGGHQHRGGAARALLWPRIRPAKGAGEALWSDSLSPRPCSATHKPPELPSAEPPRSSRALSPPTPIQASLLSPVSEGMLPQTNTRRFWGPPMTKGHPIWIILIPYFHNTVWMTWLRALPHPRPQIQHPSGIRGGAWVSVQHHWILSHPGGSERFPRPSAGVCRPCCVRGLHGSTPVAKPAAGVLATTIEPLV